MGVVSVVAAWGCTSRPAPSDAAATRARAPTSDGGTTASAEPTAIASATAASATAAIAHPPDEPPLELADARVTDQPLPPELHGTLLVGDDDARGNGRLYVTTLGPHGATPLRRLTRATAADTEHAMSLDATGRVAAFLRIPDDEVWLAEVDRGNERSVASCSLCEFPQIAADGEVWFVDRDRATRHAAIRHVAATGGPSRTWDPSGRAEWAGCDVQLRLTSDRRRAILLVQDSLGAASCAGSGLTGLFTLELGAARLTGKYPPPRLPAPVAGAVGSSLGLVHAWSDDRLLFTGFDAAGGAGVLRTFGCRLDGSGVVRWPEDAGEWTLAPAVQLDTGATTLFAQPPRGAGAAPIDVVEGLDRGGSYAFARQPGATR